MYNNSIYNSSMNIERLSRQKDEIDNLIKTYQTMNSPQPINNFINTNNRETTNSFRLNKLNDGDEVENIMITQDTIFIGTNRMQIKKLDDTIEKYMNMLYSDLHSALGDGDTEESLERYITATNDWYYDSDIKHTKENKLFKYYYNVVK